MSISVHKLLIFLSSDKEGRMFSSKVMNFAESLGIQVKTPDEFQRISGEIYPWTAGGLYSPPFDIIACAELNDFVLLHEIIHWTGHPSRVDREAVRKLSTANKNESIRSLMSVETFYNEEAIANMGMFGLAKHLRLDLKVAHYEMIARLIYMSFDHEFCEREANKAVNWILGQVNQQQAA